MTSAGGVAADQLRAFVERIERLEEEKKNISDDIKDVYAEAKGNGYDVKVMRQVVRLRKQDKNVREEMEALLDLYLHALGMASAEHNSPIDDRQEDMFQPKEEQAAPESPPSDKVLKIAAKVAITQEGKASTSFVQRRLNIGYNRAASIMEDLEQEGFISPPDHAGKRQILQSEIHPT